MKVAEDTVTVAQQFQSFIERISEQRSIAHAQSRLAEAFGEYAEERDYARMEYVFTEAHQEALGYALEPENNRTETLNIIGLDTFTQFAANVIMMQIQHFDDNDLTDASRRGWLIAYIEWARFATPEQFAELKRIREVEKAQYAVRSMNVHHLLDM